VLLRYTSGRPGSIILIRVELLIPVLGFCLLNKSLQNLSLSKICRVDALLADSLDVPDDVIQAPAYSLEILRQESWDGVQLSQNALCQNLWYPLWIKLRQQELELMVLYDLILLNLANGWP